MAMDQSTLTAHLLPFMAEWLKLPIAHQPAIIAHQGGEPVPSIPTFLLFPWFVFLASLFTTRYHQSFLRSLPFDNREKTTSSLNPSIDRLSLV
jgi:hypothetical protein